MVNEYGSVGSYDPNTGSITYSPGSAVSDYVWGGPSVGSTLFIADAIYDAAGNLVSLPSYSPADPDAPLKAANALCGSTGGLLKSLVRNVVTSAGVYVSDTDMYVDSGGNWWPKTGSGEPGDPRKTVSPVSPITKTPAVTLPKPVPVPVPLVMDERHILPVIDVPKFQGVSTDHTLETATTPPVFAGIAGFIDDIKSRVGTVNPTYIAVAIVAVIAVLFILPTASRRGM